MILYNFKLENCFILNQKYLPKMCIKSLKSFNIYSSGWTFTQNHCYQIFTPNADWNTASTNCNAQSAILCQAQNTAEYNVLQTFFK